MSLFKDLLTNLKKISTQSKKSNLQLENTISSSKISIKSIKDLKSNVKESKLNNDKSNKAFEEFNISSIELFDKINKYLKNPTPEKLLKVKNQINVSYNNLKIATTVFSENKTFTKKVVDSFSEYKNNVLVNNAKIKKLIELTQRLILSFKKNIRITKPVSKLKIIKLKTQTRKVYFSEAPTPSPDCQKLKKEVLDKKKEYAANEDKVTLLEANSDGASKIGEQYLENYKNNNAERLYYLKKNNERMSLIGLRISSQKEYERTLSNPRDGINVQITRLLKQMQASEIPNQRDTNLYNVLIKTQKDTLDLIEKNNTAIGSYTLFSKDEEFAASIKAERELEANDKDYKEYKEIIKFIFDNRNEINSLEENNLKLDNQIIALERKIKAKACP